MINKTYRFNDKQQTKPNKNSNTYIVHVRGDLLGRVGQRVKGLVALVAQHLVLDAHDGLQEHIVQRLGLDAHVQLLDAKAEPAGLLLARANDHVETGLRQARELAKAWFCFDFGSLLVEASQRKEAEVQKKRKEEVRNNETEHYREFLYPTAGGSSAHRGS